jgi:glucosamine--fructose-6-phosphate aminotransferase (isomerizing)
MGITETSIIEQFPYWREAIGPLAPLPEAPVTVFVGCGTSYNLALSLAAEANGGGRRALAAPGGEWLHRPQDYWADWRRAHVVALSRSGETTETVAAARASRAAGAFVTAITCEQQSALAQACDRLVFARTHPAEGIVMTASASLMLLMGLQLLGRAIAPAAADIAASLLASLDGALPAFIAGRSHHVFLGSGPLYGIALEAGLKLTEMSQTFTQAFHPLEYRHGPVSLVDERTAVVLLYSRDTGGPEAALAAELQQKGARVLGLGGPGELSLPVPVGTPAQGLVCLPALQFLGERVAQAKGLDTATPRHLTKVVVLG